MVGSLFLDVRSGALIAVTLPLTGKSLPPSFYPLGTLDRNSELPLQTTQLLGEVGHSEGSGTNPEFLMDNTIS